MTSLLSLVPHPWSKPRADRACPLTSERRIPVEFALLVGVVAATVLSVVLSLRALRPDLDAQRSTAVAIGELVRGAP